MSNLAKQEIVSPNDDCLPQYLMHRSILANDDDYLEGKIIEKTMHRAAENCQNYNSFNLQDLF